MSKLIPEILHASSGGADANADETVEVTRRIRRRCASSMVMVMSLATLSVGQTPSATVQSEISLAEIERTLHAIDVDRTSGSDGERAAAAYLDRKLAEYGVAHTTYNARLYLSWAGRAEITVPVLGTI